MKTNFLKKALISILGIATLALVGVVDMNAQNFDNGTAATGTGKYNASCGAVIKMKAATGTITPGTAGLGTATKPIPGVVDWSNNTSSTTQNVGAYYYEHMVLSGLSSKSVLNGVFIVSSSCATFLTGYTNLGTYPYYVDATSGTVTYAVASTFTYAGVTDQNIFPQTNYVTLNITGAGNAVVRSSDVVTAQNITSEVGAPILVDGTLNLTTGVSDIKGTIAVDAGATLTTAAGAVSISGALSSAGTITTGAGNVTASSTTDLTGSATLTLAGAGNVALNGATTTASGTSITMTGAGDLAFGGNLTLGGTLDADNGTGGLGTLSLLGASSILASGTVDVGDGTDMFITGTIANAGDGNNLNFNCGSNITYNGTQAPQVILPTLDADGHRYGNLILTNGNKQGGAGNGNNVNVCKNFTLVGGNLDMASNTGYLKLNDPTVTPLYGAGTGTENVVGKMRRTYATTTSTYAFNNYKTTIDFTTPAAAAGYYELDVTPSTAPINNDANTINRKIVMNYDLTGWVASIQAGYLSTELPAFSGGLNEDNLKFFEADGASAANIEKLAGTGYGRNKTDNIHHLSLAGILPGTGAVDGVVEKNFTSSHELEMRASNTMYSIADGRWTNKNTWDEGTVPTQVDNAEIRTSVYVGIAGSFIGTAAAGNTTPEYDYYGNTNVAAARTITVANKTGAANPALIIGNEDNPDNYIFHTALNTDNSLINNNLTSSTATFPLAVAKNGLNAGDIQGVWVISIKGANKVPALGTYQILNSGTVNNEGILEVGE
jgi:hypothetical protein